MSTASRPNARADADFEADMLAGLSAPRKRSEAKYLYDEEGSRLFDAICAAEDYYPTRTETAILEANIDRLRQWAPAGSALVELGSGSSVKTKIVLDALDTVATYVPLDISAEHLHAASERVAGEHPRLTVRPVVADFTAPMTLPRDLEEMTKILFFPGSTIGNFTTPEAQALLARLRRLRNVNALVVGVDLRKDVDVLRRAYDDSDGATAAFNKNLLSRMNRELDADFDLDAFDHEARWNPEQSRIEMHLVSRRAQTVTVAGTPVQFEEGETIHTENSHKFTVEGVRTMAADAGWRPVDLWTDPEQRFSVHVLVPAPD